MAKKGRILTGARCRFAIDGRKVGYATGVDVAETIAMEPANVLDNIEVEEFVPLGYNVTFSASWFRIIDSDGEGSVKGRGWFAERGADAAEHLRNILLSGDMVATIEDTKTGQIWAQVHELRMTSHNFRVDARGIVGENVEFVATYVKDETEV